MSKVMTTVHFPTESPSPSIVIAPCDPPLCAPTATALVCRVFLLLSLSWGLLCHKIAEGGERALSTYRNGQVENADWLSRWASENRGLLNQRAGLCHRRGEKTRNAERKYEGRQIFCCRYHEWSKTLPIPCMNISIVLEKQSYNVGISPT